MTDRFALTVQRLGRASEKVLVLADLVGSRADGHRFTATEIRQAFMDLHVPPPGNIPRTLSDLKRGKFTLPHGNGVWSLTPIGRERAREIAGNASVDMADDPQSLQAPGAEFAHVQHTVIPAWAAPPRWRVGIDRLLDEHPFETNVFCMTRFPSEGPIADPVAKALDVVRSVLRSYGLTGHLATDKIVEDDLLGNVGAYMWACQYGIGIIEDRVGRGLNYNAVIELGGMIITGRRCALLKDKDTPPLPTDLSGQIYRSVNLDDLSTVESEVDAWVSRDLGVKRRSAS